MKDILTFAIAVLTVAACTEKRQFTVEGTIEGAQDSTLYLYNQSLSGEVLMDSAKIGKDGRFQFKGDAPEAPDFYVLQLHNQIINFSIDSTETVVVKAKYPGMGANYTVEGSDNCEKIRQLALLQQDLQRRARALEHDGSLDNDQMIDSLMAMVERYKQDVSTKYIYAEPQKAYAYFALFQTLGVWNIFERKNPQDSKAFGAVATCWETYYPHALRTEHLRNTTLKGMNERRAEEARRLDNIDANIIVNAGLIELELPDATGRTRTLTELNGKVVLLDFHAYSMKESAARILEMRELYKKYHSKGLEIYQVSVDSDEHFWKQQTEHLPWVCVFDPDGTSLPSYNVQSVPEFFTIDRKGQLQNRSSQMENGVEAEIRRLL